MSNKRGRAWSASICMLAILALLLSLFAMSACDKKTEEPQNGEVASENARPVYDEKTHGKEGAVYFEGTVIELQDKFVLVAPIEGKNSSMPQDFVLVNTTTADGTTHTDFCVGEVIGVLCAPMVTMSLPAQVPTIYGFFNPQ